MEALAVNKSDELAALKERVRQSEAYDPAAQHNQELDGTPYARPLYDCYHRILNFHIAFASSSLKALASNAGKVQMAPCPRLS